MKFAKFSRTPIFTEHLQWLLLTKKLNLIWMDFLGVRFQLGEGRRGKITPCLKLVRIMLET